MDFLGFADAVSADTIRNLLMIANWQTYLASLDLKKGDQD